MSRASATNRSKGLFEMPIYCFAKVSSTNEVAKELAIKGAHEGVVVLAEIQSEGRGRCGRSWFSPEGGLWLSIIMRPKIRVDEAYKLTFIVAVSVANALIKYGLCPLIKWPNDVLVNGKKISGILTEINSKNDCIEFAVVGIGINLNNIISKSAAKHGFSAVSLRECLDERVDSDKFLRFLLNEIEDRYVEFSCIGFESILEEWKKHSYVLNRVVEVYESGVRFSGLAFGIDENGALLIRLENRKVKSIISGDIKLAESRKP